eukprot:CAMPEP_0174269944 /NCGR_PEP_ID=MMETSP0439-20130205/42766_1 /TAXON_ID=0 /ORGANISM="Stereomyxa ramosa, Strain Chinc5" /LENGTH=312 /DNA_ID=CAMNT_0015358971 /DNA_START=84 /DNA_END=1019 /DNA_ORIENTATION=-
MKVLVLLISLLAFACAVHDDERVVTAREVWGAFFNDITELQYDNIWDDYGIVGLDKPECEVGHHSSEYDFEDILLNITVCVYPVNALPFYDFEGLDEREALVPVKNKKGNEQQGALGQIIDDVFDALEVQVEETGGTFGLQPFLVNPEVVDFDYFQTALDALTAEKCDVVMMDHFITDDRTEALTNAGASWLCPYAHAPNGFYCWDQDDPQNLDDLITQENIWCLVSGSNNHEIVAEAYGNEANIKLKTTFQDALEEMADGKDPGQCNCIGWDALTLQFWSDYAFEQNCSPERHEQKQKKGISFANFPCSPR